jgi:hypothetical protein
MVRSVSGGRDTAMMGKLVPLAIASTLFVVSSAARSRRCHSTTVQKGVDAAVHGEGHIVGSVGWPAVSSGGPPRCTMP